jgi:hypothetical protein
VDGGAARLYRGLSTLDAPTLAALSEGNALRTIYRRHTDAFGTFAASFRVEGGRVRVPGGDDQAALWQDLVGASVMRPRDFLVQLAAADQGRLFFLYDTIDRLDEAHRRFALAATEPDRARREERVRALRAAFALAAPWWDAARLPFSRPVADAPRVLEAARVTADGVLAPPSRQLLDRRLRRPGRGVSRVARASGPVRARGRRLAGRAHRGRRAQPGPQPAGHAQVRAARVRGRRGRPR